MKKIASFISILMISALFAQNAFARKTLLDRLLDDVNEFVYENIDKSNGSYVGYISQDVNMRLGPSKDYKVLYKLGTGVQVTVLDTSNRYWTKIRYGGRVGYVSAECVSKKKPSAKSTPKSTTTTPKTTTTTKPTTTTQAQKVEQPKVVKESTPKHSTSEFSLEDIKNYKFKEVDSNSTEGKALTLVIKYISAGAYDKTETMFEIARQKMEDAVDTIYLESFVKICQNNFDTAIEKLTILIDDDQNYADVYNARGYAYSQKGEWSKAAKDFEKAVEICNNSTNGNLYIYKKNLQNAKENQ